MSVKDRNTVAQLNLSSGAITDIQGDIYREASIRTLSTLQHF